REVAIIVRILLGAERARLVAVGIVEPRLLDDRAALLDQIDLAARLMLDHRHDEADRIDVLGLRPRAEFRPTLANRDVYVSTRRALLHIAVARDEIAKKGSVLATIS